MAEKKEVLYSGDIEIALLADAIDRIEEFWLEQIGISDDDYLYIKKEEIHLIIGKAEILREGGEPLILIIGPIIYKILRIAEECDDIDPTVVDAKFIKPLDEELILDLSKGKDRIITVEDNVLEGGFGSAVLELFTKNGIKKNVLRIGIPDRFIAHGSKNELLESVGMGMNDLKEKIMGFTK